VTRSEKRKLLLQAQAECNYKLSCLDFVWKLANPGKEIPGNGWIWPTSEQQWARML